MSFTNYDKCSLLIPMDGSNNGTTFTDWSPNPKTVTVVGNAKTVTTQSKYYGSSGYFDGTGDYLTLVPEAIGTSDFLIMYWVYWTTLKNITHFDFRGGVGITSRPVLYTTSSETILRYYVGGADRIVSPSGTLIQNTWQHIAVSRVANVTRLFVDGTQVGSSWDDASTYSAGAVGYIGRNDVAGYDYAGYMQDFAMFIGFGVSDSFTPPARLIGEISGNVKDINGNNASRIIHAIPRSNPSGVFSTTSDGVTGNYTLRTPAIEVSRIVLANEVDLYNDKIDRIIPE